MEGHTYRKMKMEIESDVLESGKIDKKYVLFFAAIGFSTIFRHWIQRQRKSDPFMELLARMAESDSEEDDE